MNRLSYILIAAASLMTAMPALADDVTTASTNTAAAPVNARIGQLIRDANGRRIGTIDSIRGNDAMVIMDMNIYHIPLSTLSEGAKGLQTSLRRADLR